uniref:NADH dehydrogenase subunit 6 n=1 Tax=Antonbruunia milenae TaxID=3053535 RepID=UPI0030E0AEBB
MLMWVSMMITFSLGFSMVMAATPLSLGLWILFLSMMISILVYYVTFSWVSFLIFLIYVGALLVMFSYFSAIQPNNFIELGKMIGCFNFAMFLMDFPFCSVSVTPLSFLSGNCLSLTSIYLPSNMSVILLVIYILSITLVSVVKVSSSTKGPLRPFL